MLEGYKRQVVRYAQQAEREGLCRHRSGNFSVRDKETGYIVITPTGMDARRCCRKMSSSSTCRAVLSRP